MFKKFSDFVLWFVLVEFGLTVGIPLEAEIPCAVMCLVALFRLLKSLEAFAVSLSED